MTFSKQKKHILRPQKGRGAATFFLALAVAAAFFVPYIVSDGGYFFFFGDFNVQQIPFYKMCHEAVRNGNFGWSFTTDLGSSFIGSYSFYLLGSPFFWLTVPFPNNFVPYLMGPLLILKFACAALTAYLYIRRFTRTPAAAQLGGLLYAFSGFSIYNVFFNHFHEAIIVLPLLLLSMELLVTENRRGVFALCVALAAVVNYFFFAGMAVFCVLYWFIRTVSGAYRFRFGRFMALVFEALLGVALAAFLLFPSAAILFGNGRVTSLQTGWGAILYGKEQIYFNIIECFFFPPDLPSRPVFFPGAGVKWSSLGGWLPVFGMSAVLAFVSARKGSWLKRILCVCAFMAMVPVLNSAFYAFNDSYYARWFYMPVLMMCLCCAVTCEDESIDWRHGWRITALITAAIALIIGLFPQKIDDKIVLGLYTDAGEEDKTMLYRFLATVAISVVALLLCRVLIALRRVEKKVFFRTAIALVCVISTLYAAVFIFEGKEHSYSVDNVMIPQLVEGNVNLPDKSEQNYRVDVYDGVDNTAMFLGLPSINAFHSVITPSIIDFYEFIGQKRDVASRPETQCYSIRSLLSVRYLLNRTDGKSFTDETGKTAMPGYHFVTNDGGYRIYENDSYIPYGFSYDYYMSRSECELLYKDTARADMMLKAIVLEDEDAAAYKGNMKHYSDLLGTMDSALLAPDEIFGDGADLTEDISSADATDSSENTDGQTTSVVSSDEQTVWGISTAMDSKTLASDAKHLAKSSATYVSAKNSTLDATVTRENESLVFFSVPYDRGWSVTVNGEKADILKANIGFMAVNVPAGTSKIVFTYRTPWLILGLSVSVVALAALILYLIFAAIVKKSNPVTEIYPEGDRLLLEWQKKELADSTVLLTEEIVTDAPQEEFDYLKEPEDNEPVKQKYASGFRIDLGKLDDSVDKQENS